MFKNFFPIIVFLCDNVEKYGTAGQVTDYKNTVQKTCKNTLAVEPV